MSSETVGTILYALILLIGLAMLLRPSLFKSEFSTEKGSRLLGVIFTMVGAANLIDRLAGSGS